MADEVDSLILEASVVDNFSRELEELSDDLDEIAGKEAAVDPIEIDAHIASALAKIEALDQKLNSLRDQTVNVDVESDNVGPIFDPRMPSLLRDPETGRAAAPPGGGMASPFSGADRDHPLFGGTGSMSIFGSMSNEQIRHILFGPGGDDRDPDMLTPAISAATPDRHLFERMFKGLGFDTEKMRELGGEFGSLRLRMSQLMSILAALVPLFVVFVAAVPAAVAGIVALGAAALAAAGVLAGIGGLAMMGLVMSGGEFNVEQLEARITSLFDSFLTAIEPIAEVMESLAIEGFLMMERLIARTTTELDTMLAMIDEARFVMDEFARLVPNFIDDGLRFVNMLLPALFSMMGALGEFNLFRVLSGILADTLPLLVAIASMIGRTLPAIFQLSRGFLVVATALTLFFTGLLQLVNTFPHLAAGLGVLIGSLLVLVTVTSLYSLVNVELIQTLLGLAASALPSTIASVHALIASYIGATGATIALTLATAALIGLLTFGLGPVVASIAGGFSSMSGNIREATRAMRRFQNENTIGGMSSPTASGPERGGYGRSGDIIVAPDEETGRKVSRTNRFYNSEVKPDEDIGNRIHTL